MPFLLTVAELVAARERIAKAAGQASPKPAPAPAFVYKERTRAQWANRANQSVRSTFGVAVEPDPEMEDSEAAADDDDDGDKLKSKLGPNTACLCGHKRSDHHVTPEPHVAAGDSAYYCITSHCDVYGYRDGKHAPCDCQHFRAQETDAPKLTRPRVGDYDLCANPACGHWKIDHCTKSKPGKALRLKSGELAYKILSKPEGIAYPCKHFSLTDTACQCTSTSCSATPDGKEFCGCEKFISPLLRTRAKALATPRAPRQPSKKKAAFTTGTGELFPPLAVPPNVEA